MMIRKGKFAAGIALAGRDEAAVDDLQNFSNGDFGRLAREKIAPVNAATAHENPAAFEFEENLLEIFYGDTMSFGDLIERDNRRMLRREMKHSLRCVLAFG